MRHLGRVLAPRDLRCCFLAGLVGEIVQPDAPVVRIPIAVLILRSRPMRWVPSDDEAVPFFPHLFPNVGVSILEESSLRLQNCRLAVGSDCCVPGCVLQEKRQGKRLPLHNIAPSRQHLGDATHFSEGAAVKGAGNNSGRHDSSAGSFVVPVASVPKTRLLASTV